VVTTRVGYAGGTRRGPDYHHTGDHRESVEVVYDPSRTSYRKLLAAFWGAHPAVGPRGPLRTREAVLYTDEAQRRQALASRLQVARAAGEPVSTEVIPVGRFWAAEATNQKANLQRMAPDLVRQLAARYGGREKFLASAAAARLNAYVGGFAGEEAVAAAAAELGVPTGELLSRLPR
jgi:peptide-methionine (S)-S-oxide reductase